VISSTWHVDTAVSLPKIAIPNAVEVTVSLPVEPPPARTVTGVSVTISEFRVFLAPASHSASHPVGSGSGAGKKVKSVKASRPVSVINAILQILILSEIAPAPLSKLKIVPSVIDKGLPLTLPPFSRLTVIFEVGNVVISCSIIFFICATHAQLTEEAIP
jgi:hypothetical protein